MLRRYALLPLVLALAALVAPAFTPIAPPAHAASFSDISSSTSEQQRAIRALAAKDIIRGCTTSRFCPEDELTRAQVASLLARAKGLKPTNGAQFRDVSGTHAANINALADAGITEGCAPNRFCPDEKVTRGQLASMLARAYGPSRTSENFFDDVPGVHAGNVNALAKAGIAAGCGDPLTAYCSSDTVIRGHAAVFIARAENEVPRIKVSSYAQRKAEQDRIDAEQARLAEARRVSQREDIWDSLAQCESNGNWQANTGNGYYGGLQFLPSTWRSVGGSGLPHQHSREEQIRRAEILQQRSGWGQWPACSRRLGLR